MEFLGSLAGYGNHGLLVKDTNDMPKPVVWLWNKKYVSVVADNSFEPMANGKITITSIGRKALESIDALPLFNKANEQSNG